MKCPICKKEMVFPRYAWHNSERYQQSVLVVSQCCNKPIRLRPKVVFDAVEYTGERTEDDWGMKIPQ